MGVKGGDSETQPPPVRRSRNKGEASRKHILGVCARMFRTGQYRSATMRDIAREAGIALGGLYFHFKSKDELIGALIERGSRAIYEQVKSSLDGLDPSATSRQKIEVAIRAHVDAAVRDGEYPLTFSYMREEVAPNAYMDGYIALREAHRQLWMKLITEAQLDGTLRADVPPMMVFFFIHGAMGWVPDWFDAGRMTPDRVGDYFSLFLLDGTATPARPRQGS